MTGGRGFWATRSEDHITALLFQPFACLSSSDWISSLVLYSGLPEINAKQSRFAFACEETLDAELASRHGRNFVIPDIMLEWKGDTTGLIAFEVKKPRGAIPNAKDITKLETYSLLPSTRYLNRKDGVFLVDDQHVTTLKRGGHAAIGWSFIHAILMMALDHEHGPADQIAELANDLTSVFKSAGVRPRSVKMPHGRRGTLSPTLKGLADGLKVRATFLSGREVSPPYDWLVQEPTESDIAALRPQSTASRRVNRWSLDWSLSAEVE